MGPAYLQPFDVYPYAICFDYLPGYEVYLVRLVAGGIIFLLRLHHEYDLDLIVLTPFCWFWIR